MKKQRFKANGKFWKKSISGIACASMVLANCNGDFLLNPMKAFADNPPVSYLDTSGSEATDPITSYSTITSSSTTWNAGWYVVDDTESVTINDRVEVSGNVNLILKNGCSLNCSKGITVDYGNSLTVYAQSKDSTTMGSLTATGESGNRNAAIGAVEKKGCGTITIAGGNISATTVDRGAAIGSGGTYQGQPALDTNRGSVVIYDGVVTANSAAAGIGSGNMVTTPSIEIHGGNVTANGDGGGAAIGSGYDKADANILIDGGVVTARTDSYGAAIGVSQYGEVPSISPTINIAGGVVRALHGNGTPGAGIGCGENHCRGITINITGGTVEAVGGSGSAGIGGGCLTQQWRNQSSDQVPEISSNITISGGFVTATAGATLTTRPVASDTHEVMTGGADSPAGIGAGTSCLPASFSTTNSGNAVIVTSSISDQTNKESWRGAIIEGTSGQVYGNTAVVPTDSFEIPAGKTLNVASGKTLTVASGKTMTNRGTVSVNENGTISNAGTLVNAASATISNGGTITGDGAITNNGTITNTGSMLFTYNQELTKVGSLSGNEVNGAGTCKYATPAANWGFDLDCQPEAPTVPSVTPASGYEISIDNGTTWSNAKIDIPATSNATKLCVRKPASTLIAESDAVECTNPFVTVNNTGSYSDGTYTVTSTSDAQYKLDSGEWGNSNTFEIDPSTKGSWTFGAKVAATSTTFAREVYHTIYPVQKITLSGNRNLATGSTGTITPALSAILAHADARLNWSSSNTSIVKFINPSSEEVASLSNLESENVTIKAFGVGTATITAEASDGYGAAAQFVVTVENASVGRSTTVGGAEQLTANVSTTGITDPNYQWMKKPLRGGNWTNCDGDGNDSLTYTVAANDYNHLVKLVVKDGSTEVTSSTPILIKFATKTLNWNE